MSRTIRIKNNYEASVCSPWIPRYIPKNMDSKYEWVDGDKIGRNPNYEYRIEVPDDSKKSIWRKRRSLYGQVRAGNSWRNPSKWIKKLVNSRKRNKANRDLRILVKEGYEDVVLETELMDMPSWTW